MPKALFKLMLTRNFCSSVMFSMASRLSTPNCLRTPLMPLAISFVPCLVFKIDPFINSTVLPTALADMNKKFLVSVDAVIIRSVLLDIAFISGSSSCAIPNFCALADMD